MAYDPLFWTVAVIGSFFVGASKGGLPAVALLSVPLLSLVMAPMQAAALLLPVFIVSDVFGLALYRRLYSRQNLAILIPAAMFGIVLGWVFAGWTDDDAVRLVVGLVSLGFVAQRLWIRLRGEPAPRPARVPQGVFWGAIAGFTSFVAHAGGPAFQIFALPQRLPKMVFAGTATILFAFVNLAKIPPYLALGLFQGDQMLLAALLAPVALLGALSGYRLTLLMPERVFFLVVELALLVLAVTLIRAGLAPILS